MPKIRSAKDGDVDRMIAIARAAYIKYVPRIGREPPPMLADFAAEIAAGHVVVIDVARAVNGYLISWPQIEAYFIDNIAVDPAHQGLGLGRQLMEYAVREAKRHNLSAIQLYTNATMTENLAMYAHLGFVETHRVMDTQFHIETGFSSGLYVSASSLKAKAATLNPPRLRTVVVLSPQVEGSHALTWRKTALCTTTNLTCQ